jgi:hypothetical protein
VGIRVAAAQKLASAALTDPGLGVVVLKTVMKMTRCRGEFSRAVRAKCVLCRRNRCSGHRLSPHCKVAVVELQRQHPRLGTARERDLNLSTRGILGRSSCLGDDAAIVTRFD